MKLTNSSFKYFLHIWEKEDIEYHFGIYFLFAQRRADKKTFFSNVFLKLCLEMICKILERQEPRLFHWRYMCTVLLYDGLVGSTVIFLTPNSKFLFSCNSATIRTVRAKRTQINHWCTRTWKVSMRFWWVGISFSFNWIEMSAKLFIQQFIASSDKRKTPTKIYPQVV